MERQISSENNFDRVYEELKKDTFLWDLFTKKEEYPPCQVDRHGRFSFHTSKYKDVLRPSVSEYLINKGYHLEYPDRKKFCVVLTHDVDDVYVSLRHFLFSLRFQPRLKNLSRCFSLSQGLVNHAKISYINFNKIIEIEQMYDAVSTFFFLSSARDIFGKKYSYEAIQKDIVSVLEQGCELGFHTGYYHYANSKEIQKEKKRMERLFKVKILGARNHVLRFDTPESWETLSNAGFSYDSTFGYHDMIGFRNGMCHPFVPFNLYTMKKINIVEIPLHIQDLTLWHMNLSPDDRWKYIKNLMDVTMKCNGVLTILWHTWIFSLPTSYGGVFGKEWTDLYIKILEYANQNGAWITNCQTLFQHAQQNGLLKKTTPRKINEGDA